MAVLPLLTLELDPSDPVARLGDWLRAAGLELDVRALYDGQAPPDDLSAHSGVLVMGGKWNVHDDAQAPFLPAVRALLRHAVAAQRPALGVCLGGQLLAVANGGRVQPDAQASEIGAQLVAKRSAAASDPLFRELPITPDVVQWHHDAITALPPGAILLAGSPVCENQAFRLGRLAWGLQFHIETTPETMDVWAQDPELAEYDLDTVVARAKAIHDDLAQAWQPFAQAFAAVVRDPDSVPAAGGVPAAGAAALSDPAAVRAALAAEASAARAPLHLPMPQVRPNGHD